MRTEIRVHEPGSSRKRGDAPPKVAFIDVHTVEAVEKSPKGYSYPARSRQVADNGRFELVRTFFVDFDVEIPDELFEPVK
jgi:hypothetical protein